jgi:hypothetical protein
VPTPDVPSFEGPGHDVDWRSESRAAADVRCLAVRGELAERARTASPEDYASLWRGAYEIVWPVVYEGVTRAVERRRGHGPCANGIEHLEQECLDRFHDDVEAVIDYLLRCATVPIRNLEGWIRSRLAKATVDGHRRRRGQRGAQQRPRLPQWLERLLGDDPWLRTLAVDILTWVGVPTTAGTGLWPYSAWAERRAALTGDVRSTEHDVARDIETVLSAMRHNATWYQRFVERPLGRKQAPLVAIDGEPPYLALTEPHEAQDAWQRELAAVAIDVMSVRIAQGEDRRSVVIDVINTVFGKLTPAHDHWSDDSDARLDALLADQTAIDQIVRLVCEILGIPDD